MIFEIACHSISVRMWFGTVSMMSFLYSPSPVGASFTSEFILIPAALLRLIS